MVEGRHRTVIALRLKLFIVPGAKTIAPSRLSKRKEIESDVEET